MDTMGMESMDDDEEPVVRQRGMSDEDLLAAIDAEEEAAIGSLQGDIAADRADAIDRYLGKAYTDDLAPVVGRSSVVSRDVADVVEGVLANILKPFVAGDRVVEFEPRGEEDEKAAEQESDYCNFVALERNNGFLVLNAGIKDALLVRNGYVRCDWAKRSDVMIERYQGMSEPEMMMLASDPDVEIFEHQSYPDPSFPVNAPGMSAQGAATVPPRAGGMPANPQQGPQMPPGGPQQGGSLPEGMQPMGPPPAPPMLHDVRVRRKRPTEYVETVPLPCNQILVGEHTVTPTLQDSDFVQIRSPVSISYLRQKGYEVDDEIPDSDDYDSVEDMARSRFGQHRDLYDDVTSDPARRIVMFKETFIRIDRDGDGIAELRRVCSVSRRILTYANKPGQYNAGQKADEETDIIPVACFACVVMPHQHLALSVYDMVVDVAKLKTALLRQFMDNKYLANNQRVAINHQFVDQDDLLISRPGGVVRCNGNPAEMIMPLISPDTGASALQALEYLDNVRGGRTGYTQHMEGMDPDVLHGKPSVPLQQAYSQAQLRLEMMARTAAETGVRDLFRIIHALTLKHSSRAEKIRLRNKWVDIDPRAWVKRTDMSISVGLGTGNTEQMFGKLMALAPMQMQMVQAQLAGPEEAYNFAAEVYKAAGFKNPDRFVKAPQIDPQTGRMPEQFPQPPNPQLEIEKAKLQARQQEKQADMQLEGQKMQMQAQMEQQKAQMDAKMAQMKVQMESQAAQGRAAAELELQRSNDARQGQLDQQRFQMEMAAQERKFQLEQQTEIEKAKIQAQTQIEIAVIKSQSIAARGMGTAQ